MTKARWMFLIVGGSHLAGCGGDPPQEPAGSLPTLDSAGVEIIVNQGPDTVLVLDEVMRVGVVEGDPTYQFDRIRALAADRRGGFWVVDGHEAVRHYAPDGEYLGSVGARGGGPGEAEAYTNVWAGDTDVIASGNPGGLQQFSPDGTLVASRAWRTEDGALIVPLGYSNGQWVLTTEQTPSDGGEMFRRDLRVFAAPTVSDAWHPVKSFRGQLWREGRGGRGSFFQGNPSLAVGASGYLFVSDTLEYQVTQYRMDGTVARIVRRETEPKPYDEQYQREVEIGVEAWLRHGPFGDRNPDLPIDEEEFRRIVAGARPTGPPDHVPFVERILVSPSGFLWVQRADRHPQPGMRAVAHSSGYVRWGWRPEWIAETVFDVFDPEGRYVGTATFPREYALMEVSDDRVYGVWYGDDGVEFVVAYAGLR